MLEFFLICIVLAVVFFIRDSVLFYCLYLFINTFSVIVYLILIVLYPFQWFFGLFSNSEDIEEPEASEETQEADEEELNLYETPYIVFRLVANFVTLIILISVIFTFNGRWFTFAVITYIPATIIYEIFLFIISLNNSAETNETS